MALDHATLLAEWQVDNNIDSTNIINELTRTPKLHAKYLEYYLTSKSRLIIAEKKYNTMRWVKRKYFRGEMEKAELMERGWSQWNGLKPSNSELNDLFESDRDLNDLLEKAKYHQMLVQGVEFIMKQIAQRDWSLKSIVEHMKYMNGG